MSVMTVVALGLILVTVLFGVAVMSPRSAKPRRESPKNQTRRMLAVALCVLAGAAAMQAQETAQTLPPVAAARPEKPPSLLTNEEIVQMVKSGFAEETILKAIQLSETRFDTSVAALLELKNAGVSDAVIRAMLNPKPAKVEEKPAPPEKNPLVPDDIGVYYVHNERLEEMHPEPLTWRTGGVAKSLLLGTKGHINGVLKGTQSKLRVGMPLEFVVRLTESVDITEYLLIRLDVKPDRREFRALTGGYIHASSGLDRNSVPFTFEKIAPRTYRIRLKDMPIGEYGFLPPAGQFGAIGGGVSGAMIMQGSATVGKMYTFAILE